MYFFVYMHTSIYHVLRLHAQIDHEQSIVKNTKSQNRSIIQNWKNRNWFSLKMKKTTITAHR